MGRIRENVGRIGWYKVGYGSTSPIVIGLIFSRRWWRLVLRNTVSRARKTLPGNPANLPGRTRRTVSPYRERQKRRQLRNDVGPEVKIRKLPPIDSKNVKLSNPGNREFVSFDLRNAFGAFPILAQYRNYFAFTDPDVQRYAPAIKPHGYGLAPFICAAGVSIAFGAIPPPDPEPPLVPRNVPRRRRGGIPIDRGTERTLPLDFPDLTILNYILLFPPDRLV